MQLQIAMRAAALLKVGGLMAYSTCSLNPLENESVVAELLRRCEGSMELVDASSLCPELDRAPGLTTWTVLDDEIVPHASYAELLATKSKALPRALKRRFMPSMWAPPERECRTSLHLDRCLRLLPHLANMGGFFVALLRKKAPMRGPSRPKGATAVHHSSIKPPPCTGGVSATGKAGGGNGDGSVHANGDGRCGRLVHAPPSALAELSTHLGLKAERLAKLGPNLLTFSSSSTVVSAAAPTSTPPPTSVAAPTVVSAPTSTVVSTTATATAAASSARNAVICRIAPELVPVCAPPPELAVGTRLVRPMRIIAAGCTLARKSRHGRYRQTIEGARMLPRYACASHTLVAACIIIDGARALNFPPTTTYLDLHHL